MNKAQRKPYLGLTKVVIEAEYIKGTDLEHPFSGGNMGLCHFCKYASWLGSPCRDDSELECTHPLAKQERWEPSEVWVGNGADCWGFRPDVAIDEAADILGIFLRGEWI